MDQIISVENSAPSQNIPAKSVIIASEIIYKLGVRSIVDFGCGRLRNIPSLEKHFNKIILVDTKVQCDKIKNNSLFKSHYELYSTEEFANLNNTYDAIFLILVLHIVPEISVRKEILNIIPSKLSANGFLIVDVPTGEKYYRQKCNEKNRYNDGWIMGTGNIKTFYKQYSAIELDNFIIENSKLKLSQKINVDKHLIRIFKSI
jgi:hypothetical protein